VDIRGHSFNLRVNYRTSHQIRSQADKLLDSELTDADGNVEKRDNPVSAFNGPAPTINTFAAPEKEILAVADWLAARRSNGVAPREMAVFVRSEGEIPRYVSASRQAVDF
jgi:superfamily I DNA/RNA helicase